MHKAIPLILKQSKISYVYRVQTTSITSRHKPPFPRSLTRSDSSAISNFFRSSLCLPLVQIEEVSFPLYSFLKVIHFCYFSIFTCTLRIESVQTEFVLAWVSQFITFYFLIRSKFSFHLQSRGNSSQIRKVSGSWFLSPLSSVCMLRKLNTHLNQVKMAG